MNSFYSNGKLLITGEYLVLDEARALALPTKFGQSLTIQKIGYSKLIWESYTDQDELWFQIEFDLPKLRIITATFESNNDGGNDSIAEILQNILIETKKLNPRFLSNNQGFYAKSKLTFPRDWGLGSSSTLINNIAEWSNVNAFQLQFNTFGGSAYDIACAQNNVPIIYQLKENKPHVEKVNFNPSFKEALYFVYLNKKQNSRNGIAKYKNFTGNVKKFTQDVSRLTDKVVNCSDISTFEQIMKEHEQIISSIIKKEPIQQELFPDYFGQIKSLGAWGGDFVLATGNEDTPQYFSKKGFKTVIPYADMIL